MKGKRLEVSHLLLAGWVLGSRVRRIKSVPGVPGVGLGAIAVVPFFWAFILAFIAMAIVAALMQS